MLESPELTLDRPTAPIKLARPFGLARDERVETIGFDPRTCRRAFPDCLPSHPVLMARSRNLTTSMPREPDS